MRSKTKRTVSGISLKGYRWVSEFQDIFCMHMESTSWNVFLKEGFHMLIDDFEMSFLLVWALFLRIWASIVLFISVFVRLYYLFHIMYFSIRKRRGNCLLSTIDYVLWALREWTLISTENFPEIFSNYWFMIGWKGYLSHVTRWPCWKINFSKTVVMVLIWKSAAFSTYNRLLCIMWGGTFK